MSPKRGDRAAPPPGPDEWDVRFLGTAPAKGWEELCRHSPGNARTAWMAMREAPAPAVQSPRQHRMQYDLATGPVRGQSCDRWQIEVTGGGRIWYLVGPENQTVWIDYAGPAHPRATD